MGNQSAVVEMEIPPRSQYVGVVRLALASLARSAALQEDTVDDLKIAVSEACTNAVLSNESAGVDQPVSISWAEESDRIIVEIADRGHLYDGDSSRDSWDSGNVTPRVTMSVALLSTLVDDCHFVPRDGGGTVARLIVVR